MTRRGGIFDKIGNWYEQGCVLLQWLRLMLGHAQSLIWEAPGPDGDGIDYWLREDGKRLSAQCKTRSSKPWSPSSLRVSLEHARARLDSGADIYRFVTDLKPQSLIDATDAARRQVPPAAWLADDTEDRRAFVRSLGCDPADPTELSIAVGLLARIDVHAVGQEFLRERIWESAVALVGRDQAERLLYLLFELARPTSLGREWTALGLMEVLEPSGIVLNGIGGGASSMVWLAERCRLFLDQIHASRRGRPQIERQETTPLIELGDGALAGEIILVHGSPGTGKSGVIAQAVEAWRSRNVPVLAMRSDAVNDPLTGADPVGRFRGLVGDGHGFLIIDQLDQAASAGSYALPTVRGWIQTAAEAGITVIIGCRTVDALHETQLYQLVHHLGRAPKTLKVGDYPESVVTSALTPLGVRLEDLGGDLRKLVRNPLALSLLVDLIAHSGAWHGGGTTVDLVDAWCRLLAQEYGVQVSSVMDSIAQRMEIDNVIAVDRHLLPAHLAGTVAELVLAGILIEERDGRVRLFHQVIADMRIAVTWAGADDADHFLRMLGLRDQQGLQDARRARLCIARLANRGATGAAIIGTIAWHNGVRPMVKRALLMGLADLDAVPGQLRVTMLDWMRVPERRAMLTQTVLHGHLAWFDALDGSLDEAWRTWPPDQRGMLLSLCASVARRRGDTVARHLTTWEGLTPGTVAQAQWVFWHDPAEDTEDLFRLRLEHSAQDPHHDYHPEWSKLMITHPLRTIPLLAAFLHKMPAAKLLAFDPPDWMHGWPASDSIPESMLAVGHEAITRLLPWWATIEVEYLYEVPTRPEDRPEGALVLLAEFLADCAASAIGARRLSWIDLQGRLPNPLRPLDEWILLRIGHRLDRNRVGQADFVAAATWFRSDPRFSQLRVGIRGEEGPLSLARAFLATVAPALPDGAYAEVLRWLIDYSDQWTTEDEKRRLYIGEHFGDLAPNHHGRTPYLLLPLLGRPRWTAEARAYHDQLERKFGPYANALLPERMGIGGLVRSKVPDEAADRWSNDEWIERLRSAPLNDDHWKQMGHRHIGKYTREMVVDSLRRLASRRPQRYRLLALAVGQPSSGAAPGAQSALIDGLSRTKPPDQNPGDWMLLSDEHFAEIVTSPSFMLDPGCARDVARAVELRANFSWPDSMVERLIGIATEGIGEFKPTTKPRDRELTTYRINDAACIALNALAAIAAHHPARRPDLLRNAQAFADHPDLGRRASAAFLALRCSPVDAMLAGQVALRVATDPFVAAEHDIHDGLLWLAHSDLVDETTHDDAKTILLDLASHSDAEISGQGGIAALCLRAWGKINHPTMIQRLALNPFARRAAAEQAAFWLTERDVPGWLKEYAIALANDPDTDTGQKAFWVFKHQGIGHLLEDHGFVTGMAGSAAAKRDPEPLVDACDKHGQLMKLAEVVLVLARHTADPERQSTDRWNAAREAKETADLLTRLAEAARQDGDDQIERRALDALDAVIERGLLGPGEVWGAMTLESEN